MQVALTETSDHPSPPSGRAIRIERYRDFAEFATYRRDWESLSVRNPMLSPAWVIPWWDTYQTSTRRQLCWLAGFNRDQLVGIAPFYVDHSKGRQGSLRILGDGRTCSDHQTVLARPVHRTAFLRQVADWLSERVGDEWGAGYWECLPARDENVTLLMDLLQQRGILVLQRPSCSTWQVDLPPTWEAYLSGLSKNQRKRCRRWHRQWVEPGKIVRKSITRADELDEAFDNLCRLHNARIRRVADAGVFENTQFREFHRAAMRELLADNQLRLDFLHLDGNPIACEYLFSDADTVYSYQSGFDPEFESISAGSISLMMAINAAIEDGYRTFDFLRGDEPYKQRWGAIESETVDIHIHRRNLSGSLRRAGLGVVDFLRSMRNRVIGR